MKIKARLQNLFNRTAHSQAGQFVIDNAGTISGISFALADLTLIAKDYFFEGKTPDRYEQLSGATFLLTDAVLALTDKYPVLKKLAGGMFIVGGGLLGYSGMGSEGQNAQLISSGIIGAQGLSLIFENSLQNFAERMAAGEKGILKTVFTPLAKYPVATTSAIGAVSMVSLFIAAVQKPDLGLMFVSMLGMIGQISLMATDNNIKVLSNKPAAAPKLQEN